MQRVWIRWRLAHRPWLAQGHKGGGSTQRSERMPKLPFYDNVALVDEVAGLLDGARIVAHWAAQLSFRSTNPSARLTLRQIARALRTRWPMPLPCFLRDQTMGPGPVRRFIARGATDENVHGAAVALLARQQFGGDRNRARTGEWPTTDCRVGALTRSRR